MAGVGSYQTPAPTPIIDQPASLAKTTVGDLLSAAVPIAEAAIVSAVPFLGAPVIKQLWGQILNMIVSAISNAIGDGAAFLVMDVQTYSEVTNAATAINALKAAQSTGDENAISNARAQADAAAAQLLHYNGSA